MIRHQSRAHWSTQKTTLGELLANDGLTRFPQHTTSGTGGRPQCTDEDPSNAIPPGGYAICLRCELLVCQDPREEMRRRATVEIFTEAQVHIRGFADLIHWD